LDRLCNIQLGKTGALAGGAKVFQRLRNLIRPETLLAGFSGPVFARQIFPRGYPLYDPQFSCGESKVEIPLRFRTKPAEILISPERIHFDVKKKIDDLMFQATGIKPRFREVPLETLSKEMIRGDFDFYAGVEGLAEPDPEEALSFFLESQTPLILPIYNTFLKQFDEARRKQNDLEKLKGMKAILKSAVCEGYVLPLFHLSTFVIGRPEFDFSQAPHSDEYIEFFNLRFKKGVEVAP
jgi:hypothetical protein